MTLPWTPRLRAGLRGAPRREEERRPGRLWRLEDEGGGLWLKRCASTRAAEAEARSCSAGLPGTPRLRALDRPARCVLLEELPGEDVESIGLTENTELHRAAGRWLARLHALPLDEDDPMPLAEALQARLDSLRRSLPAADLPLAALQEALESLDLSGARRVRCHRDFQPRNWRWHGEALGVLDFEHARPDHPMVDLAKLEAAHWPGRPALREAFLEGYGRPLRAEERAALRVLVGLEGLFALSWGRRHGDAAFMQLGEGVLARWS
ncbi:MAG: phosphotransferase [Alphaproteobacteria bacterium]|nr:phosphotransferase [Alphaproteobacteria bacterium]MCB9795303.1 phosphotransferase [Alphaproteobacteria bacterium]